MVTTLKDQLLDLRNYCTRYGKIVDDVSCELAGNHNRITRYLVDGVLITISMKNGDVSGVIYK